MTAPLQFEIEEAEGADLGRVEAGRAVACDRCGGESYTGPRCTRCTFASRPSPPWPVGREGSKKILAQSGAEPVQTPGPGFVCPAWCVHGEPGPVTDLANVAAERGWRVRVQHSRGVLAGASTVNDLWSVRFRRPGWAGYAVRVGDAWKSVAVSGETLPPFLALGVTELREWLKQPERPVSWYAAIRKRVRDQDLASKVRACPGPGVCDIQGPWLFVQAAGLSAGQGTLVPPSGPDHTHRANGAIKIKKSKKEVQHGA
jgi:hypothetical protein